MPKETQTKRAHIYIVHTELEWQIAKAIARALDAYGYAVAPTKTLELPDRAVVPALPADADAVIVIWPIAPTEFGMPTLALEARAAAQRGNLVQIYAGVARPDEPYSGPAPVDFTAWDRDHKSKQFTALMRRLRPLCGGPTTRPRDDNGSTQNAVLLGTLAVTLGAILFALGQSSRHGEPQTAAAPSLPVTTAEEGSGHVALSAAVAKGKRVDEANFAAEPNQPGFGGPDGYEKDIGLDAADPRLAPHAAPPAPPPAPAARAPQGPEQ